MKCSQFILLTTFCFASLVTIAQTKNEKFLSPKKSNNSVTNDSIAQRIEQAKTAILNADRFVKYKGKVIREIKFVQLKFGQNINDTTKFHQSLGERLSNALHKKTNKKYINYNLFFEVGDQVEPYLLADNERYLRDIAIFQDAKIVIEPLTNQDEVNVVVITKDVFSIGADVNFADPSRFDFVLKDENLAGRAGKLSLKYLYDANRSPTNGFGIEWIQRNVFGSLAEWTIGATSYKSALSTGRTQENYVYTRLNKPLISAYIPFVYQGEIGYHITANNFNSDSDYFSKVRYNYFECDMWGGYNFGKPNFKSSQQQSRLRKFFALRLIHKDFAAKPDIIPVTQTYDYLRTTGFLSSFNLFKQNFYKTQFIYGFGRQEDVPEGYNLAITAGWTNRNSRSRPYYGLDLGRNFFSKKGNYYNYTLRFGGYIYDKTFEDIDMLANLEYFSRLKKVGLGWFCRSFINVGITQQIRPFLNQGLFLSSPFGLPEFNNGTIVANTRAVAKLEKVLYNKYKLIGFNFAPFAFFNSAFLIPNNETIKKSDVYTSLGAGLRIRNEALVFGTMELKYTYFPRVNANMNQIRIDFNTELRFKYNSQFVKRPDFVSSNY